MLCHIADKIYGYNIIDIYGYFSRCQVAINMRKLQYILGVISYVSFENVARVKSTSIIISTS